MQGMTKPTKVTVNEAYQTGYTYTRTEPVGKHFDPGFTPQLTPKEMLHLGIFGGDYFSEPPNEFPEDWFKGVPLSPSGADAKLNYFGVNASQPLSVWQQKGWIYFEDPHGWFLWYCRYYLGRRIPKEDARQIKRWHNMRRHVSQLQNSCQPGDTQCQPRRRQALLHWAYDTRKL
jgi:hypothetical protein